MKKIFPAILMLLFVLMSVSSYSLNNFNYTGIAFDGSGTIIKWSTTTTVRIQLIVSGSIQYDETHSNVSTNQFGTYTIKVGTGSVNSGSLSSVSASKQLRLKSTTDNGGTAGVWVVSSILKPTVAVTSGGAINMTDNHVAVWDTALSSFVDGIIIDNGTVIKVDGNILPASSQKTIGTNADPWENIYAQFGEISDLTTGILRAFGTTVLGNVGGSDRVYFNALVSTNIVPDGNGTHNLGELGIKWGAVYAQTLSGELFGNAMSATALQNSRNFSVTGDVVTSSAVSFDGTADVALNVAFAPGVIVDADVNSAAAIAGTKISPDFGTQNVNTSGNLRIDGNLTLGDDATTDIMTVNSAFVSKYNWDNSGMAFTIPNGTMVMDIDAAATATNYTVTMPSGTNGQILYINLHNVGNGEVTINGTAYNADTKLTIVYTNDAWVTF